VIVGVICLALGLTLMYLGVKGISLQQFYQSLTTGKGTPEGQGANKK
jgi:hypothetical protein